MHDWRSDPTWRHAQRLFVDGVATMHVRDEEVEGVDPEGAAMLAASAPAKPPAATSAHPAATAPPPPVDPAEQPDPRHAKRNRQILSGEGFDDDAWTTMGGESTFDLHGAGVAAGTHTAGTPVAYAAPASPPPAAPSPPPGAPSGGYIPGEGGAYNADGYGTSGQPGQGFGSGGHGTPTLPPTGAVPGAAGGWSSESPEPSAPPVHEVYDPEPLPEDEHDADIDSAVFPGASWGAPPAALRGLAALGPLPDPGATVDDPERLAAGAHTRDALFNDPDVVAARAALLLPAPPPSGPSVLRQLFSLVVVLGLLGGVIGWQRYEHRAPAGDPRPAWATEWDPTVVDLVAFVQKARGLTFDHPVAIDFVEPAAFETTVAAEGGHPSAAPVTGPDDPRGLLLDALGLPRPGTDSPGETEPTTTTAAPGAGTTSGDTDAGDDQGGRIDGYYDPATRHIRVRGTDLGSDAIKGVVVHELTHALQDQHFDLGQLPAASSKSAYEAARAAAEGDASVVEFAYFESLAHPGRPVTPTPEAFTGTVALMVDDAAGRPRPERDLESAVEALRYSLAVPAVQLLTGRGGRTERDSLFTDPPQSEADILFPDRRMLRVPVAEVSPPPVDKGDKRVGGADASDVGAYLLALAAMNAGVSPIDAVHMARGWGGDAYTAFRRAGKPCARIDISALDDSSADATRKAFTTWADAGAAVGAERSVDTVADAGSGMLRLTACAGRPPAAADDSSQGAAKGAEPAQKASGFYELVLVRMFALNLASNVAFSAGTLTERRCFADTTMDTYAAAVGSDGDRGRQAGEAAATRCSVAPETAAAISRAWQESPVRYPDYGSTTSTAGGPADPAPANPAAGDPAAAAPAPVDPAAPTGG